MVRSLFSSSWSWQIIFLTLFFLLTFNPVFGQKEGQSLIGHIEVKIDGQTAPPEMRDLIPLQSGGPFSLFLIRQTINHLYLSRLFSKVQVFQEGNNPVNLIFDLERQLYLRQIFYFVGDGITSDIIKREMKSIREGEAFDEAFLESGRSEVKKILEQMGFYRSEIQVKVEKVPESGFVDLSWRIIPGERLKISRVSWTGEAEKLGLKEKGIINLEPGEAYNPRELEAKCLSLQQRLRRLGFPRAEVSWIALVDEEKGWVEIGLNPQLHEKVILEFKGAKVPADLVAPLWEEKVFEEWALSEGKARIINYLRRKGHLKAQVKSQFFREESQIRVVYDIDPGPKQRIASVVFSGQNYFSEESLRQALRIPFRAPLTNIIDGERVYELPRQLEAFYQMKGFPRAKVFFDLEEKGKAVVAKLYIEEGPLERVGEMRFSPNLSFSEKQLLSQLRIRPGEPYYSPQIKLECQRIVDFYLQQGFRGTSVSVEETEESPGIYSLYFNVEEGQRYRIRRIFFSGLVFTKQVTIRKEMSLREGEWANWRLIQETKRNLERLGIFASIQVEEIPILEQLDLIFRFYEGERNLASVGIGLETKSEPRNFEIWNNVLRLRGTAEIVRTNLLGDASQLSFVNQMSLKETRGAISWEQPYFFGLPLRGYMNVWLEREERVSFGFDRRGLSLSGIKPLTGDLMTVWTLRYLRTVLTHLEITESEVDRQFFPFSSTSLSTSFIRDRRDDSFNPERGYFASGVLEWAFPLFRTESNFLKSFIKYQRFFQLAPKWDIATTFRFGLGRGRMPIHERFFAGGSNSFRGEEFDELGPKDPTSDKPVGGKALILLNLEFTFPLAASLPGVSGAIFYDLGNVFSKRSQFSLAELKHALGVGVRYRTPLGPLRFEIAWNLSKRQKIARPLLFITIGQIF